jgi:Tol biopolymer transport system component
MRRHLAVAVVVSAILTAGIAPAWATFPGSNGNIAFISSTRRGKDIGVIDPDGSDRTRLTTSRWRDDWDPTWSSDGTMIVFWSYGRHLKIHTMAADGSDPTVVYVAPRRVTEIIRPVWSPDGTKIAFSAAVGRRRHRKIFVMNADGSSVVNISPPRAHDIAPDWSPDGTKIAFRSGLKLMTMDADGLNRQQLVDRRAFYPSWSPDGSQIAYGSLGCDIYVVDADGTNETQITETDRRECDPVFSPDGTKLAFSGNGDLYVLTLANGSIERLAAHSRPHEFFPSWQPV